MMGAKVFNTAKGNHKYKNVEEEKTLLSGVGIGYISVKIFLDSSTYIYIDIYTHTV